MLQMANTPLSLPLPVEEAVSCPPVTTNNTKTGKMNRELSDTHDVYTRGRRRPAILRRKSIKSSSAEFKLLAKKKLRLMRIREKILLEENDRAKEKHEQEMKNLLLLAEEVQLRIKILRLNNINLEL